MVRLGLTGGIGSGKSTVAAMLSACGAQVIDADAISRATTAAGGQAIEAIARAFGPRFITAEGALDRERMRDATFSDSDVRTRLEAIIHPLVGQETARQEAAAAATGTALLVFDVPLLVESRRWRQRVDSVLVVDCPPEVQLARVQARSGLAPDAIHRIIESQAPRELRLRAADLVIFNGRDSLTSLSGEVAILAARFGL
jgi:dephospho-CoA kinase